MNRAEKRRQKKLAQNASKSTKAGQPLEPSQSLDLTTALNLAVQYHSAGDLAKAENLYQQILQSDPNHPVALQFLGVLAHQVGKNDIAVDLISKAIALKPDYAEAHNNLGLVFKEQGKLDDAVSSYFKALTFKSDYAGAHNNLGIVFTQQGKLDDAVSSYSKALAINPDYAEAHSNLGLTLQEQGKLDDAVASYRKAIAINPDYAEAYSNLGVVLQEQGKLDDAVASYRRAITINPDYAEASYNLGLAFQEHRKLDDAVASYRQTLVIKPDFVEAHNNLGVVHKEQGKLDDAVASYREAIAIKPDYAEAHSNLGVVLLEQGKLDDAVASYIKALTFDPNFFGAHNNLGTAFKEQGKLDDAVASYHKALAIKPDFAEAHRHLSSINRHTQYDDDIKAMEIIYNAPESSDEQRMHLAFGLGKAFEDLKQFEKSFKYISVGNALRRQKLNYDIESTRKYFGNLKSLFTKDFFSQHVDTGISDDTPVFILGMPRSGTSLVEQILASHPNVYGAGELSDLINIVEHSFRKTSDKGFSASVQGASIDQFRDAARKYIKRLKVHSPEHGLVTDKMPQNFELIGMIKLMFPNAKIIHCRRDPMDTCLSIFKNYFTSDELAYAYEQNELGLHYKLYENLMAYWRDVLPDFIYEINYEDVVADQRKQTEALLAFCGLDWDDACLDFHNTKRSVKTASAAQVRQPIYTDSIKAWKRYEKQLAPLHSALQLS